MKISAMLNNELSPPNTVDKAGNRLLIILSESDCSVIASTQEDELIEFHFCLGAAIRNAFGLYHPGSELLSDCGPGMYPDDASQIIIWAIFS